MSIIPFSREGIRGFARQGVRFLCIAALVLAGASAPLTDVDWPTHNGGPGGEHYSPLAQINRGNVDGLTEAWRFETGPGGLQTSPLVVGRVLYGYTPSLNVFALDAATGEQIWRFDPGIPGTQPSRGLAYWRSGGEARLLAGVVNRLYALDPDTGRPIPGFGQNGYVDLRDGLGPNSAILAVYLTSPGIVYEDVIIVGFRTSEGHPAAPGAIRAYDVRTGELRWSFSAIPAPGSPGSETWPAGYETMAGGANNWAGMALDAKRGIVYAPTGSAVPDFYGVDRHGDNLYANTLLALDARTGQRIWHFQAVRHDLWDRDLPSPPVLLTVNHAGRRVDAVAQPTKHGMLFVFDRVTGEPLFPIEDRPVLQSNVPGQQTAATQPFADIPAAFARQHLTEDMLSRRTPAVHAWAVEQFRSFISRGLFTPFEVDRQTVVFPGFDGGANWGGAGVDVQTGVIYINASDVAWTGGLVENIPGSGIGQSTYLNICASCHGADRNGFPPHFPSLRDQVASLTPAQIETAIRTGMGRMPAFPQIANSPALRAVIHYVMTGEEAPQEEEAPARAVDATGPQVTPLGGAPPTEQYRFSGFRKFLDPEGYPAVEPPWGTLNAIDLNTGNYLWKVPLGEYPELAAQGLTNTGTENYGGPLVTAGGLVIIGATNFDARIRAFHSETGQVLWQAEMPYSGNATPITYTIDGKQYVVIAASNARNRQATPGSGYIAFALPNRR